MVKSALTTVPLTPRIGTEVRTDVDTLLSGVYAKDILDLLDARGVLCFRDIDFTDEQQMAFTRTLGEIHSEAKNGIMKVSADKKANPNQTLADYQRSSICWHMDGAMDVLPMRAVMMSARALPDEGAGTEFINCYAAYEDLPDADKELIKNLKAIHTFETMMRHINPWPTYAELTTWQKARGPRPQPLVWTHKSGRKSLVLGATASHVEGMSLEEGRALLCRLHEWAAQPQYKYLHAWKTGDLLMWGNTGVLHRAMPYQLDSGRLMHRTSIVGVEVPG